METWVEQGSEVPPFYDPLVAKLIVHGTDRGAAVECLIAALAACRLSGIESNLAYLRQVVASEDFARGDLVFWKGHVAIGLDAERILHANAHHMAVAIEPLDAALKRIKAAGPGEPTAFRRP